MADAQPLAFDSLGAGPPVPWNQRLIEALPVAPSLAGIAIAATHVALGLVYFAIVAGIPGSGESLADLWREFGPTTIVFAILIGYVPAASTYSRRAQLNGLRALRPALRCSDATLRELARDLLSFNTRMQRVIGALSAVISVIVTLADPSVERTRSVGDPALFWNLWQNALASWLAARLIVHELRVSRAFSRIGWEHTQVDLFNLRPLAAFVHRGLQGALAIILAISIFSLLFVIGRAATSVPFVQGFVVVIAVVALLLPVYGVHRRIVVEKLAQLERLSAGIRTAQEGVLGPGADASPDGAARLSSLLALKGHIESVREWPFDLPTLARFALYVGIGLSSWLGAALVERFLDLVID
jgi:hypothetical protein